MKSRTRHHALIWTKTELQASYLAPVCKIGNLPHNDWSSNLSMNLIAKLTFIFLLDAHEYCYIDVAVLEVERSTKHG